MATHAPDTHSFITAVFYDRARAERAHDAVGRRPGIDASDVLVVSTQADDASREALPDAHAGLYDDALDDGAVVLGTRLRDAADVRYVEDTWRGHGGERVHTSALPTGAYNGPAADVNASDAAADAPAVGQEQAAAEQHASEADADAFRRHHEQTYGADDDYAARASAYAFGYDAGQADAFRERSFADAEKDLRDRFGARHSQASWERSREAIRYAFGRARSGPGGADRDLASTTSTSSL